MSQCIAGLCIHKSLARLQPQATQAKGTCFTAQAEQSPTWQKQSSKKEASCDLQACPSQGEADTCLPACPYKGATCPIKGEGKASFQACPVQGAKSSPQAASSTQKATAIKCSQANKRPYRAEHVLADHCILQGRCPYSYVAIVTQTSNHRNRIEHGRRMTYITCLSR